MRVTARPGADEVVADSNPLTVSVCASMDSGEPDASDPFIVTLSDTLTEVDVDISTVVPLAMSTSLNPRLE